MFAGKAQIATWDGTSDYSWYTTNPDATIFEIGSPEALSGLSDIVNGTATDPNNGGAAIPKDNFTGKTVKLTADIKMNEDNFKENLGTALSFSPIGGTKLKYSPFTPTGDVSNDNDQYFGGTFDGQYHFISNVYLNSPEGGMHIGLFGSVAGGATIENLFLKNVFLKAYSYKAALIGTTYRNSAQPVNIQNVMVIGFDVFDSADEKYNGRTLSWNRLGGLVGIYGSSRDRSESKRVNMLNCAVLGNVGGVNADLGNNNTGCFGGEGGGGFATNCYFFGTTNRLCIDPVNNNVPCANDASKNNAAAMNVHLGGDLSNPATQGAVPNGTYGAVTLYDYATAEIQFKTEDFIATLGDGWKPDPGFNNGFPILKGYGLTSYTLSTTYTIKDMNTGETAPYVGNLFLSDLAWGNNGVLPVWGNDNITVHFGNTARYHILSITIDNISYPATHVEHVFNNIQENHTIDILCYEDCGLNDLPWTEYFQTVNSGIPDCWSYAGLGTPEVVTTEQNTTPNALALPKGSEGNTLLVFPELGNNLPVSLQNLYLQFALKPAARALDIEVGIMSDAAHPTSFIPVKKLDIKGTEWATHVVYFNGYEGTGKYIAIKVKSAIANNYIDDIKIDALGNCPAITGLHVENQSMSSAILAWDILPGIASYNAEYIAEAEVETGTWTALPAVMDNRCALTCLDTIAYRARVSPGCGGTPVEVAFSISRPDPTIGAGYTETGWGDRVLYNRWHAYNYTQQIYLAPEVGKARTLNSVSFQFIHTNSNTRYTEVYLGYTNRNSFETTADFLPGSQLTKVFEGDVNWNNGGENYWINLPFNVANFEWNAEDNLVIAVKTGTGQTDWQQPCFYMHYPSDITTGSNDNKVIYLAANDIVPIDNPLSLDWYDAGIADRRTNIRFLPAAAYPSCIEPNALGITEMGSDYAVLTWVAGDCNSESGHYILEYRSDTDTAWAEVDNFTETTYTIDLLQPNTNYKVRVKRVCDEQNSSAWTTIAFTTSCATLHETDLPANWDFEDVVENEIPGCWTRAASGGQVPAGPFVKKNIPRGEVSGYNSEQGLDFGLTPMSYTLVALTELGNDIDKSNLMLSFAAKLKGEAGKGSTPVLTVGMMSNPNDMTTFELVQTLDVQSEWSLYDVLFENYTGSGTYIVFKCEGGDTRTFGIDNIKVSYKSTCMPPTRVVVDYLAPHSVTFSWDDPNNHTEWQAVLMSTTAPADWDNDPSVLTFGGTEKTIDSLSAMTAYVLHFRAKCGDEYSDERTVSFTTKCDYISEIPYNENFDNLTEFPECWSTLGTGGGGYLDKGSLFFPQNPTVGNYLVMPEIDPNINMGALELSFYYAVAKPSGTFEIGLMSDPADLLTYTKIEELVLTKENYAGATHTISFKGYGHAGHYIAFRSVVDMNNHQIDNVHIGEVNTCLPVKDMVIGDITQTSASVSWSPVEDTPDYSVWYYNNDNGALIDEAIVGEPSMLLAALSPGTSYLVKVKPNCSTTVDTASISFKTVTEEGCEDLIAGSNDPNNFYTYIKTFPLNAGANAGAFTWTQTVYTASEMREKAGNITEIAYRYIHTLPATGSLQLYLSHTDQNAGYSVGKADDKVKVFDGTVSFNNSEEWFSMAVGATACATCADFEYNGHDNLCLIVGFTPDATSGTGSDGAFVTERTEGRMQTYCESNCNSNPTSLGEHVVWVNGQDMRALTRFTVCGDTASCVPVSLLTAFAEATTATVSWKYTGESDLYEVEYKLASAPDTEWTNMGEINSLTIDIDEDIEPNETYQVRVRAICGEDEYSLWKTATFTAGCYSLDIPFVEAFETTADGEVPDCWGRIVTAYQGSVGVSGNDGIIGTRGLSLGRANNAYNALVTPLLNVDDISKLTLRFAAMLKLAGKDPTPSGTFVAGVMSNPEDWATFVRIDEFEFAELGTWTTRTVSLAPYTTLSRGSNGKYLAFAWYTPIAEVTYLNYACIDSIEVFETEGETCESPHGIRVSDITEHEAVVSWEPGTATRWLIDYKKNNESTWTNQATCEEPTYTLTGLEAGTFYIVRVLVPCETGPDVWDADTFSTANSSIPTYIITASVNNPAWGSITPSGTVQVQAGANQSFEINPASDYRLTNITLDNNIVVDGDTADNPCIYLLQNVQNNHTLIAHFEQIESIGTLSAIDNIKIYPNPAKNELKIENGECKTGDKIEIYDLLGKLQQSSIVNRQSSIQTIDISTLSAGMYLLRLYTSEGMITKKFVKE
jgi:hypothetical protein